MARRTFIGNLYKLVKDPNLVASMSGHANGSVAFARYSAIDDDMKKELIDLIKQNLVFLFRHNDVLKVEIHVCLTDFTLGQQTLGATDLSNYHPPKTVLLLKRKIELFRYNNQ